MSSFTRTLYVGVSNDMARRVHEHKGKQGAGFTARYDINNLVCAEQCSDVNEAIAREKQIKGWSRGKKIALIESMNPAWEDLKIQPFCHPERSEGSCFVPSPGSDTARFLTAFGMTTAFKRNAACASQSSAPLA